MKFLRHKSIHWLFGLKENRIVSKTAHDSRPVRDVLTSAGDEQVHLRGYGQVRIIRRDDPHGVPRFYVTSMLDMTLEAFNLHHERHWNIETYHRAIKQLCTAEGCSTRSATAQKNHLFCVLRAFSFLEREVLEGRLQNWYALKRNLYLEAARSFIQTTGVGFVSA
ncbi:transposase [Candidatus Peregrinibacteria bacterium]|nr:transposase [Candidatus Peregrinibacteria bacterium]